MITRHRHAGPLDADAGAGADGAAATGTLLFFARQSQVFRPWVARSPDKGAGVRQAGAIVLPGPGLLTAEQTRLAAEAMERSVGDENASWAAGMV